MFYICSLRRVSVPNTSRPVTDDATIGSDSEETKIYASDEENETNDGLSNLWTAMRSHSSNNR